MVSLPSSSNLLNLVPLLGLEKNSADSESLLGPRNFCEVLTALSVCHAPLEIPLLEGFPLAPWCLAASQEILDLITCFHCFSSLWPWGWGLGVQQGRVSSGLLGIDPISMGCPADKVRQHVLRGLEGWCGLYSLSYGPGHTLL